MTPIKEWWYFTFGCGHLLAGRFIKLYGTREDTRAAIVKQFGPCWSHQYDEGEWNKDGISQDVKWGYTEIKVKEPEV